MARGSSHVIPPSEHANWRGPDRSPRRDPLALASGLRSGLETRAKNTTPDTCLRHDSELARAEVGERLIRPSVKLR